MRKLITYLAVLGLGLGVVALNRSLAQDTKPIHPDGCCVTLSRDIDP